MLAFIELFEAPPAFSVDLRRVDSQDKRFLVRAVQLHALVLLWAPHHRRALTQTKHSAWLVGSDQDSPLQTSAV